MVVISDTHYLLRPELQGGEWQSIREFPGRAERALRLAAALGADAVVHLGDVTHEYPETGEAQRSREGAKAQFAALGLRPYVAPGNMDIGDKPDPTSPAEWVTPETLAAWDATFGRSWQSFDLHDVHGIVLNSCIMNGPLPQAEEQRRWLEADLEANRGKRIVLFQHHPIFFVDPAERAGGMYNSLDDLARTWLLDLMREYGVEMAFAGHTHFVAVNHYGVTRLFTAPSTTTSRAGLVEAFTVSPPDRGRSDLPKLGFYLVRDTGPDTGLADDAAPQTADQPAAPTPNPRASVHLIRTGLDTPALDPDDPRALVLTRTSRDLPQSPLGIVASHPIGHFTPGPVIWPSVVRQRVRDDWRFEALLEIGARRLRVPESDLAEPSERPRLEVLRAEGVDVVPYWLWTGRLDLPAAVTPHRDLVDEVEVLFTGDPLPGADCLRQIDRLQQDGLRVTLSTAIRTRAANNHYHTRTRVGYLPDELPALDRALAEHGAHVDRVVVRLSAKRSPWDEAAALRALPPLPNVGAIDLALDFPDQDEVAHASLAAEALFATAALPGAHLWLGPLLDMDRSMDVSHGLLDRLSNPRPAFHVVRLLNSILFATPPPDGYRVLETPTTPDLPVGPGVRTLALTAGDKRLWLCLPAAHGDTSGASVGGTLDLPASGPLTCYHLAEGTSERVDPTLAGITAAITRTALSLVLASDAQAGRS